MIKYITSRPLWFNILIALGFVVVVFVIFILSLNWITKHGESKTVPAVIGKDINQVSKLLSDAGFELVIQDSVFYDSLARGVVVKQIPEADQVVKVNRTVYVIINRFITPDISMPNIVGYSLRNAELTLQSLGLRRGDTTVVPDFARGSVKEMRFNGRTLKPGDKIKMGSKVDLVIAGGPGIEDMAVPKLVGLRFAEARVLAEANGLLINPIAHGITDVDNAYVYRQIPMSKTPEGTHIRIRQGQMIDVFLQVNPVNLDSLNNNNEPPQSPEE
jgi:eukaryotic-like serine/threonine-protein kinase